MASADRTNPYVLLQVPFGESRDQATKAFTRRAKGLRRRADGAALLTQLTWALNQVAEAVKDPQAAVHIYRVPADEAALVPRGTGVLRPPPEPRERRTGSSLAALAKLTDEARAEAVSALRTAVSQHSTLPPR